MTEINHGIFGRIWRVGDAIDTDLIVPSRVLTEQDPAKLLAATLELVFPHFSRDVKPGDIIVAGKNFGCGSSREEAVFVLKELGISCIIAENFARIFFRNCINLGLPPITSVTSQDVGKHGDNVEIDLAKGIIRNTTLNQSWTFAPFPHFLQEYLEHGGAFARIKHQAKNSLE